ncbi:MAG: hypothetical protein L6Q98_04115 [Anaerolineae bacterium]|nr:hypothetical protein [Anaerolineae bacterium]NUQ07194.1 hypothetical protein [Anaerolineae bacterium]
MNAHEINLNSFITFLRAANQKYESAVAALAAFDQLHSNDWSIEVWEAREPLSGVVNSAAASVAELVSHYFQRIEQMESAQP